MASLIPAAQIAEISALVADRLCLDFPPRRWPDLERGINDAAKQCGYADPITYAQSLIAGSLGRQEIELLASHLTIGETYFFREKEAFHALENYLLPAIFNNGKRLCRIWSAGCCTGEEPYSIAMLIDSRRDFFPPEAIRIVATDINPQFLRHAAAGVYKEWSFRAMPPELKQKYFEPTRAGYRIAPHIQKMVSFSYLNLADDAYPAPENGTANIDIIFCRNVLMYFSPPQAARVIDRFYHSLAADAWLIVSPVETSPVLYPQFTAVHWHGAMLYRKGCAQHTPAHVGQATEPSAAAILECIVPQPPESLPCQTSVAPEQPKQTAIQADVTAPPDPFTQAQIFYEQRQYQQAERQLQQLLALPACRPEASLLLARVYADQGKLSDALAVAEKNLAADRLNPRLHYFLATVMLEQGSSAQAKAALQKAIYLDHDFAIAHFSMANLALREGNRKLARQHLQNTLSIAAASDPQQVVPESGGMTAENLLTIVRSMIARSGL